MWKVWKSSPIASTFQRTRGPTSFEDGGVANERAAVDCHEVQVACEVDDELAVRAAFVGIGDREGAVQAARIDSCIEGEWSW